MSGGGSQFPDLFPTSQSGLSRVSRRVEVLALWQSEVERTKALCLSGQMRSGARNASEIVMLTLRMLQLSRLATLSTQVYDSIESDTAVPRAVSPEVQRKTAGAVLPERDQSAINLLITF